MTVSVRGAELFYSTRGKGPTCLVLSAIGTKPYERQTPRELSDRLRLVYVDLRGAGRSTGEPTDLTFDALADDLEAIRGDLEVERIAVLGHSILGMLAIEYGRRRPASVSHVIAVGTPPSGDLARLSAEAGRFFEQDASEERKRTIFPIFTLGSTGRRPVAACASTHFSEQSSHAATSLARENWLPIIVSRCRFASE